MLKAPENQRMLKEPENPSMAWPLLVFLCASSENADFTFFGDCVDTMKANFGRAHLNHLESVMSNLTIIRNRIEGYHPEVVFQDTLDILLCRGGLEQITE